MIYVLESAAFINDRFESIIKIGYTYNWKDRFAAYKTHNPTVKVLFLFEEGNEDDEKLIHSYFRDFKLSSESGEWYKYDKIIVDFFKRRDIETIRKVTRLFNSLNITTDGCSNKCYLYSLVNCLVDGIDEIKTK